MNTLKVICSILVVHGVLVAFTATMHAADVGPRTVIHPVAVKETANAPERELDLLQVIGLAFASNPDIQSAQERVRIADALLASARAELYPRLSASENFATTNIPSNAFMFLLNQGRFSFDRNLNHPGFVDDFQTQAALQQTLYAGGRRLAQIDAARAQRQADACALDVVRNEMVFHVAEAYYRLLQARALVQVRRTAVEQVDRHLKIVQTRLKAETAVRSDVLSVEVRLAEARESLITAENQRELAWAVLENVVGTRLPRAALPVAMPPAPGHNTLAPFRPSLLRLSSKGRRLER